MSQKQNLIALLINESVSKWASKSVSERVKAFVNSELLLTLNHITTLFSKNKKKNTGTFAVHLDAKKVTHFTQNLEQNLMSS